jgi:hypothetical protein
MEGVQLLASLHLHIGVWQGVAMDSLKFHLGLPRPTLLRPADRPPLIRTYGRFRSVPPARRAARSRFLPVGHLMPYAYACLPTPASK